MAGWVMAEIYSLKVHDNHLRKLVVDEALGNMFRILEEKKKEEVKVNEKRMQSRFYGTRRN